MLVLSPPSHSNIPTAKVTLLTNNCCSIQLSKNFCKNNSNNVDLKNSGPVVLSTIPIETKVSQTNYSNSNPTPAEPKQNEPLASQFILWNIR